MEIIKALGEIQRFFEKNAERHEKEAEMQRRYSEQIREIMQGQVDNSLSPGQIAPLMEKLTETERQLFNGLGDGIKLLEFAKHFDISRKTVETHSVNLRKKMRVANLNELRALAVKMKHATFDTSKD